VDYATIAALRDRHPAWRLLRAGNSTLILSFLGGYFVEGNRGACSASELAGALDDRCHRRWISRAKWRWVVEVPRTSGSA